MYPIQNPQMNQEVMISYRQNGEDHITKATIIRLWASGNITVKTHDGRTFVRKVVFKVVTSGVLSSLQDMYRTLPQSGRVRTRSRNKKEEDRSTEENAGIHRHGLRTLHNNGSTVEYSRVPEIPQPLLV
jgi:hypothetical protein